MLATYADRPDVIAISLPVDIWDYLGWKDTLASDKNSERQKFYAKARGDGAIYTPQVVINGMVGVNGNDPAAIDKAIATTDAELKTKRVPLRFWHERNSIVIEAGDAPPGLQVKEATIWFAVVQKSAKVLIQRGENHGKTLTYANIVREMMPVGELERQSDQPAARARVRHAARDGGLHRAAAGGQGRPHHRRRLDRTVVGRAPRPECLLGAIW